jgi:hypothetical protein
MWLVMPCPNDISGTTVAAPALPNYQKFYTMKLLTALAGGLVGAYALNLLHQSIKNADVDAPHVDELGMEALSTGMEKMGVEPPKGKKLYDWTLTGDIVANTMYYSLAGIGKSNGAPARGTFLGLLAGVGAVYLPEQMNLSTEPTNRTTRTQFMTVGLYTFGGVVAGLTMRLLGINTKKAKKVAKKEAKEIKGKLKHGVAETRDTVKMLAKDARENVQTMVKDTKKKAKDLKKKVA